MTSFRCKHREQKGGLRIFWSLSFWLIGLQDICCLACLIWAPSIVTVYMTENKENETVQLQLTPSHSPFNSRNHVYDNNKCIPLFNRECNCIACSCRVAVWSTNYFNRPSVTAKCLFCGKLWLLMMSCGLLVPLLLKWERSSEIPSSISQLSHYDYTWVWGRKNAGPLVFHLCSPPYRTLARLFTSCGA